MNVAILSSGVLLGLAGSLHCLGMCGPLSWALPIRHLPKPQQTGLLMIFQFGRIFSYGVLGLIVGSLGTILNLTGIQQTISIGLGASILVFGTLILAPHWISNWKPIALFQARLNQSIQRFWNQSLHPFRMLLLGSLNGWLPCGMVYLALFTGLTLPRVADAWLLMTAFGIGTIPAMMGISMGGLWVGREIRVRLRQVVPVMVSVVGLLLILRGLNLNIPYLSPDLPSGQLNDPIQCATDSHP